MNIRYFIASILLCVSSLAGAFDVDGIHHYGPGHNIGEFSVDGHSCGNAGNPRGNSGSNTMCSLELPEKWRPGIKMKVRWWVNNWEADGSRLKKGDTGQAYEAEAEVERYQPHGMTSNFEVHFFPGGIVRLVPNAYGPAEEDTRPDQTPPLTELPVYMSGRSWYEIGTYEAKQKHEALTEEEKGWLKKNIDKESAYCTFLNRLYKSRGYDAEKIKTEMAEVARKKRMGYRPGYAAYLDQVMIRAGLDERTVSELMNDTSQWSLEKFDQLISEYLAKAKALQGRKP